MSVFNQPRKRVIQMIILGMVVLIITRLFFLQIVEKKYAKLADANAVLRKVIYPSRGIIYDRQNRSILGNDVLYDLVVTPASVKSIDTGYLCNILKIDKEEFRKRIVTAIVKNGRVRQSVFAPLLAPEVFGQLQESMYLFQPGFELVPPANPLLPLFRSSQYSRLYCGDLPRHVKGYRHLCLLQLRRLSRIHWSGKDLRVRADGTKRYTIPGQG